MLEREIFSETRSIRIRASRPGDGRQFHGRERCQSGQGLARAPPGGKMRFDVYLLDKAHYRSIRSVACLNGARLERCLDG
jgi:hypothetical protein